MPAPTAIVEGFAELFHLGLNFRKKDPTLYRGLRAAMLAPAGASGLRRFRARARGSVLAGTKSGLSGWSYLALPVAMMQAGMAPRGHKLSTFAGAAVPSLAYIAGTVVGGPWLGMAASLALDSVIQNRITAGVQSFSEMSRKASSANMGGGFHDSQASFTMRQLALREMSGSLVNVRQHLGKEAQLLHS